MVRRHSLLVAIALVGWTVASYFFFSEWRERGQLETLSTRREGQLWLAMTEQQRQFYLGGVIRGYVSGQQVMCAQVEDAQVLREHKETTSCFSDIPRFTKRPEDYSREVTAFYSRYVEYRHVPLDDLLLQLSDQKSRSIGEIHSLLEKKELR